MKKAVLLILAIAATVVVAPMPVAQAGSYQHCGSISNPYPNTRYEGIPISNIRAQNVRCERARRVARGAHRKALRQPPSNEVRFRWRGWRVRGDLSGRHDHYVARRGDKRVRWTF